MVKLQGKIEGTLVIRGGTNAIVSGNGEGCWGDRKSVV